MIGRRIGTSKLGNNSENEDPRKERIYGPVRSLRKRLRQGFSSEYARWGLAYLRQFRVRDPRPSPHLRVLQRQGDRARRRGRRPLLLLRPLREHGRSRRRLRQGLTVDQVLP